MEMTLTLPAARNTLLLKLSDEEYDWTECFLLASQQVYLGADTLHFVVQGLLKAVGEMETGEVGQIDGQSVSYAFALHETYHTLYFTDDGSRRLLFWQAAKTSPVTTLATLDLTPPQRTLWQQQLKAFEEQVVLRRVRHATITKELAEIGGGTEALK